MIKQNGDTSADTMRIIFAVPVLEIQPSKSQKLVWINFNDNVSSFQNP